jgi:FKBP-type peptidyl-prolyl cis-trans isomerase FkpA/FKBP-type peptidyl-prolyl cis-trans isomerase FklB
LKDGAGELPKPTDSVDAHYTGTFVNGEKFDSSRDSGKPYRASLQGGVIRGWLEALAEMKAGEQRLLIIPPNLAYGKQGRPGIPPDSYLVFDLEAVAIVPPGN